ncbi:MAG: CusA/CzcA family heavy metal efflux RND transporter [Candidatus Margulisiibacteriota bacterium]
MIEKIIEFSAKNRLLVLLVIIFTIVAAIWAAQRVPLDAIPDLSDTQVIIYSRWDRSPDILEDQVTYPIISALLGAPKVKAIRGFSDFGYSYVYVIFEDGTDLYWARARVLEYLSKILPRLPEGVKTEMGPDATSVGWVYQYALTDTSGKHNLADLRSLQDWTLRYHLQSVPGVAEVAPIGGFSKQYQVTVDPNLLLAYRMPIGQVIDSVRKSNNEAGGRLLEIAGAEFMVKAKGYIQSPEDIEKIVVGSDPATGTPITVKQVARVELGPDIRRGVSDFNGLGDTVGGIVIMRQGENALNVIRRVKDKIAQLEPTLPEGVHITPVYDRSDLILRSIKTLVHSLGEEMIIVSVVILFFLWHFPSALVPILTIPVAVILAFLPLYWLGITSNIMSLAGIAISIGVLVDGAIIQVENAYKKLEDWDGKEDFRPKLLSAIKEVGPSVFFALLVITVSFLPIFTLVDQEGRLFTPLAVTKTLVLGIAAILAVTLTPAILSLLGAVFTKGKHFTEEQHPVSKRLFKVYEPVCRWVLDHRKTTLGFALILVLSTVPVFLKLGSEFMPPLNEGALLYMPTALPGMSVTEAQRMIQVQDKIIKSFPEVETVFGKAGRADTPTDPAPFSMVETTIVLKPDAQRRIGDIQNAMNEKLSFAGMPNIWTMPIKNRIDMLSTGIRTPIGIKILGPDLGVIQSIGTRIEQVLRDVPGTRTAFAERTAGGYYVEFTPDRDALARYGLTIEDVQMTIMSAIGGETISTVINGRERYAINVRYPREFRDNIPKLGRVLVGTPAGAQIPLGELGTIQATEGPAMIRNENGQLAGYVYVDISHSDIGGYLKNAKAAVSASVRVPKGYVLNWSGQYENMQRVKQRLAVILPITLLAIVLLLYFNTKSMAKTGIVLLAVPFSLVGSVWLLYALGYNLSIATWVGMIALMGLDAETGIFMLLFLDMAYRDSVRQGTMNSAQDLKEAIVHGAVKRIRPKMMTVMAAFMGLLPLMWSMGTGADVMKRIAAPMVGGLVTSFVLELLIYPVIYFYWRSKKVPGSSAM